MSDNARKRSGELNMATLFIPIKCHDITESQQFIEVPVSEFPDNPADLIAILQAEKAPLPVWLDCAVRIISFQSVNTIIFV